MAKAKKRMATRNKSSSKRSKASGRSVKRKMAAKRAPSKRGKSKLRRVIETALEPVIQNRESMAPVQATEAVVVEAAAVVGVEPAAADTVAGEHGSIQSAPSGGALEQGARGQASP